MYVFPIVVCPFVLFLLSIVLSVLRYMDSDYSFGIFKLFFTICSVPVHIVAYPYAICK